MVYTVKKNKRWVFTVFPPDLQVSRENEEKFNYGI